MATYTLTQQVNLDQTKSIPTIGQLVKQHTSTTTIAAVVYQITTEPNPILRNLSIADPDLAGPEIAWARQHTPITIHALPIAHYADLDKIHYGPPPQLPQDPSTGLTPCTDQEIRAITASTKFIRAMLSAREIVDIDSIIIATITQAARVYPVPSAFIRQCALTVAAALADQPERIENFLTLLLD
jgi:hypothetical protein